MSRMLSASAQSIARPCRTLPTISARLPEIRRNASGGVHYNQPTGYLFGEKPPPPGQRRKKEDWEFLWYAGMFGGMVFGGVLLYYKPDTSIQTWALREAKERMEARGEKVEYKPS
ncbi:hypothetical protein BN14_01385 [Rhizoctonia solani AG-1 IB]|uniref:NADH dehydrogenase [ubiquinone] 1 beta subcomplex subunit 11, mitochondrial n=2 Tax=Rhizoctonia solani TaxID=456999 RepID=A0A8H2XI65_9AGAM|nr:unnamed protein product [Rhizoctonia solani]CCO27347.1 hypothetical protein BN14_01385 [Rhizoctonia solani AG-1 IB]